jgi:hypothetical protein
MTIANEHSKMANLSHKEPRDLGLLTPGEFYDGGG